jgi:hypothetical protein
MPQPPHPWEVPDGWKSEDIPFPLDFAPTLAHTGVEQLRFPPKFTDPDAPGYWSYTFTWRTTDDAKLDAAAVGDELTTYFKGLVAAVDKDKARVTAPETIAVKAVAKGPRFELTAHMFDVFKTGNAIELVGWAERSNCAPGALWVFVLAPAKSPIREQLDRLAGQARCNQITVK